MNNYKLLISLLVLCIVSLVGCDDKDRHDAIYTIELFHDKFNSKDFDYIYTNVVSKEFKDSMTQSDYFDLMNKNLAVLGGYQYGRLLKSDQVQALIGEDNIKLVYHSTYTNYELNELFVVKKEDGKYKIKQIVYDDIHVIKLKDNK